VIADFLRISAQLCRPLSDSSNAISPSSQRLLQQQQQQQQHQREARQRLQQTSNCSVFLWQLSAQHSYDSHIELRTIRDNNATAAKYLITLQYHTRIYDNTT